MTSDLLESLDKVKNSAEDERNYVIGKELIKNSLGAIPEVPGYTSIFSDFYIEQMEKAFENLGKKLNEIWEDLKKELNKAKKSNNDGVLTKPIIDPSVYVYEAVHKNRLEGVKTTLYYKDNDGTIVKWKAEEYDQINPLITDNEGKYAWDVPEGLW